MHRDRFWELGGCDENPGGWGQQGIEVSLKAWLSGGCLKVNKKTWFAHWFRGGGGPGFPYHITGKDVDKARNYSMDLWLNNKWPLQVRDFEWVVDKFKPKNWEGKDVRFRGKTESKKNIYKENKAAESAGQPTEKKENKNKKENKEITIIYYTDNTLEPEFEKRVQQELIKAAEGKRIISVSQKPIDFGDNICVGDIGRSHHSMFYQILIGAQEAKTKYIALAEHDCMYTAEHFNFIPPKEDVFYYNSNHWFAEWNTKKEGLYSHFESDRKALSQIICAKDIFIEAIKEKISMIEAGYEIQRGVAGACEPGVAPNNKAFKGAPESAQKWKSEEFETIIPNLDIRSRKNFSGIRRGRIRQYCLPYWGSFHKVMNKIPPGKWYQEATINGAVMPTRRSNDTNQRRWQNFIKPLLPFKGEGRTFIELGCNAGFYCRKMSDRGFKAIGIEKEPIFIRHAHYWQSCEPKNVKIIEGDINDYNIPTAQIVLMANVHYWLTKEQLNKLVKKLRQRALYVLVVDRYKPVKEHKSLCGFETLKKTFKGWEIVKQAMPEGKKHYSVLFKNPSLIEKDTSELFHHQQLAKSKRFLPAYSELVRDILDGKEMDYKKTKYWDYLIWRRFKEKDMLLNRHVKLVQSILDNGFIEPLTIGRVMGFEFKENRLVDGDHRYIIARELGIKKLICKKLGA